MSGGVFDVDKSGGAIVLLITDGRFSGVSTGACIGHASPEAWAGDVVGIPNRGTLRIGDALTEGEDVVFLGYVPDADMPGLYRSARALVMPTADLMSATRHDAPTAPTTSTRCATRAKAPAAVR